MAAMFGVVGEFVGQDLNGKGTVEGSALGTEDLAYFPLAQLVDDSVVREGVVDHGNLTPLSE